MMIWKFPYYEVGEALDWDTLEDQFKWIADMKGVRQDPEWHGEGDVLVHTKLVVEALIALPEFAQLSEQEQHILVVAALMHDIEKRSTTTEEMVEGRMRITAPRHALLGEYTAREILYKDLKAPFEVREHICKLVRHHGLPLWAITKEDPSKNVIFVSTLLNTSMLAMLAKADVLGRMCQDTEELLLRIELFKELCRDNDCSGTARTFKSDYGRFQYFNKEESSPDYEPFDDLICTVTMMCALPGSGKDTYIHRQLNDLPMLSLDQIRRKHQISPTDKKKNGLVIQEAKEQARVYLRAKTDFVFNATNLTKEMRRRWISLFVDYNARVKIIYLEVPFRELLAQNFDREHVVPEKVIDRMISKLEIPNVKEAHEVVYITK